MSNGSAPGVVLVVLDGWGYRQEREGNAIELASTPTWHAAVEIVPHELCSMPADWPWAFPRARWATARWVT